MKNQTIKLKVKISNIFDVDLSNENYKNGFIMPLK